MKLKDFLRKNRGMQSVLAKHLGVSTGFINHISLGRRAVPIHHCLKIEEFTNGEVTRKDLRPDDWHLIWTDI